MKYRRIPPVSLRRLKTLAGKIGITSIVLVTPKPDGNYTNLIRAALTEHPRFILYMQEGREIDYCRLLNQLWAVTCKNEHQYAIVLPDGARDIDKLWWAIAQNNMGAIIEA